MKNFLMILVAFVLTATTFAQTKKEKIEFAVTLRDGNIITGETQINSISLLSPYGKLEIPIKNINSMELGIKSDAVYIEKIKNLCKLVSTAKGDQQKAAYAELINSGIQTIPIVYEFNMSSETIVSDTDTEVASEFSLQNALNELRDKYKITEDIADIDVIKFDSDNIVSGNYIFKNVILKTEFGTLDIPKEKIKKIDVTYENYSDGEKLYKLIASKHISGNAVGGWLKTAITVKAGQKIMITSSGEIVLASLSSGKYNPDGSATATIDDYSSETPTYGNTIFKIGENGTMVKAASKYSGIANKSGIIYISIYETVYNSANTGNYTVKIKTN